MRLLDLALLRTLSIVSRTGSISLASAQIGRTQSALSMQIQRLEDLVGQALLNRTGSGVRLTAAGEKFLAHAEPLLAMNDEILAEMSGSGLKGSVTLGCPEDYSIAFLPDLLKGSASCIPTSNCRWSARRRRNCGRCCIGG